MKIQIAEDIVFVVHRTPPGFIVGHLHFNKRPDLYLDLPDDKAIGRETIIRALQSRVKELRYEVSQVKCALQILGAEIPTDDELGTVTL